MTGPRFTKVTEHYPETSCLVDIRYKNILGNYWTVPGAFFWNGSMPCFVVFPTEHLKADYFYENDIHQIVSWRKRG